MTTLVFGHKSPDTDSTGSPIIWAWYLNEIGTPAKAVLLGEPNTEAAFVLKHWGLDKPAIIQDVTADDKVVIVDTNNPAELPPSVRLVAKDGRVLDRHALIHYAPDARTHGVIERQREIDQLAVELDRAQEAAAQAKEAVAEADATATRLQDGLTTLRRDVQALQAQVHGEQVEVLKLNQARVRYEERWAQIERDMGEIALLGAILLVLLGRAATVYPLSLMFRASRLSIGRGEQHVLWWGGLRGALALALALALPPAIPMRDTIVIATFAVVGFSVVIQGLTMPWLLKRLGFSGS